jgi:hypothetical protein
MKDHLSKTCSKASVYCPFKDQGCSKQLLRKYINQHLQSNTSLHMLLLARQNAQLKKDLDVCKVLD